MSSPKPDVFSLYSKHVLEALLMLFVFFGGFYAYVYPEIDQRLYKEGIYLKAKILAPLREQEDKCEEQKDPGEGIGTLYAPRFVSYAVPALIWFELENPCPQPIVVHIYTTSQKGQTPTLAPGIIRSFQGERRVVLQPEQNISTGLRLPMGTDKGEWNGILRVRVSLNGGQSFLDGEIADDNDELKFEYSPDKALILAFIDLVLLPPGANYTLVFLSLVTTMIWVRKYEELKIKQAQKREGEEGEVEDGCIWLQALGRTGVMVLGLLVVIALIINYIILGHLVLWVSLEVFMKGWRIALALLFFFFFIVGVRWKILGEKNSLCWQQVKRWFGRRKPRENQEN